MTQEKDYIDLADEMESDIRFIRTLLGAAVDKTHFYLGNPALLGPHGEILSCQTQEIEGLLSLAERLLDRTLKNTDSAYALLRAAA